MDRFDKSVTVQTPPELRRFTRASVLPSILDKMGKDAVNSIQFLSGGSFRTSFSSRECKVMLDDRGRIVIGSHECTIPQVDVYVHYYPFEAPHADIRGALSKFGQIKGLRDQFFPGHPDVKTGSRIIKMVVEKEIPSQLSIQGSPCRVWYRERCNICRVIVHMAASCPNKGL